jgi:hypothetical protein
VLSTFKKFVDCGHVGITDSSQFKFMYRNYLLKHIIEGKIAGRRDVTGRRDRRLKQLLDDLKEKRGYWKLKDEVLARTLLRTRFGRAYGLVVRQTAE